MKNAVATHGSPRWPAWMETENLSLAPVGSVHSRHPAGVAEPYEQRSWSALLGGLDVVDSALKRLTRAVSTWAPG